MLDRRKRNRSITRPRFSVATLSERLATLAVIFFISHNPLPFKNPSPTKLVATAMRIVVQRVKSASVTVEGKKVSQIGPGIMALVGIHEYDQQSDLDYCCKRLLGAKLWANENGAMWRHGPKTREYEILCVSQFTLYGTLTKKNQPDYKKSMKAIPAQDQYNTFLGMLRDNYEADKIKDGVFGAMMDVELINDGPVTIVIESDPQAPPPIDEDVSEEAN